MQKFQDVLDGKLKVTDLSAEELPEFVKFGQTAATTVQGEVGGLREAKRVETERVEGIKKLATDAQAIIDEAARIKGPQLSPEMQTLRNEQVEKAKERLYKSVTLTDEQKALVLEKFKALDSGKMDSEFIYRDLVAAVAATQPERFLELSQDAETRERAAQEELARQAAAGGGAPPSEEDKKKFTPEALKLAADAGITPEAATRQLTHGTKRVIEG